MFCGLTHCSFFLLWITYLKHGWGGGALASRPLPLPGSRGVEENSLAAVPCVSPRAGSSLSASRSILKAFGSLILGQKSS